MLVAADRLTCFAVDMRESVQAGRSQDSMHRRRRDVESRSELDRPLPQTHSQADAPLRHGFGCRARRPPRPRRGILHRFAGKVSIDPALDRRPGHLKSGATSLIRHPSSTTSRATFSLWRGAGAAFAWLIEAHLQAAARRHRWPPLLRSAAQCRSRTGACRVTCPVTLLTCR